MIEKSKKLHSYANKSTKFYTELFKQQQLQMGVDVNECLRLKHDVPTRWDATNDMLNRASHLKPALVSTLAKFPEIGIEFSAKEWDLMDKVCSGTNLRNNEHKTFIV